MAEHKMAHNATCRGPRLIEYVAREKVDWRRVGEALKLKERATEKQAPEITALIEERCSRGLYDRLGCGFDVTSLMEKCPWDGEKHFVTCPKCGTKCGVTHPPLDVEDAA